jgi:hypothetical protein
MLVEKLKVDFEEKGFSLYGLWITKTIKMQEMFYPRRLFHALNPMRFLIVDAEWDSIGSAEFTTTG